MIIDRVLHSVVGPEVFNLRRSNTAVLGDEAAAGATIHGLRRLDRLCANSATHKGKSPAIERVDNRKCGPFQIARTTSLAGPHLLFRVSRTDRMLLQ